jgi:hypothetical protein
MLEEDWELKDDRSSEVDEALHLADTLIEKPLSWNQPLSGPSNVPVLRFVKFRAFNRAVTQYKSLLLLLKAGQWEDALILARSLYELNLNLSEISCSGDPEGAAKRFVKFGKFLLQRLEEKRLTDRLNDAQLESQASLKITNCEKELADIAAKLDRDFGEFRTPKGKWRESWSGANVDKLAQGVAKETGGQDGQSDYFVFKLASLFTHNSPGSLFRCRRTARHLPGMTFARRSIMPAARVCSFSSMKLLFVSSI